MALAAAEVHHHPSRELQLAGITGTNGKTTTAYLVASIPEAAGEPVAMTGTVEYRLGKERRRLGGLLPKQPTCSECYASRNIGCRTAVMKPLHRPWIFIVATPWNMPSLSSQI